LTFSVYGATGIIGTYFTELYDSIAIPRDELEPLTREVLYLISTTSNFYTNPWIHSDTNLTALLKRLEACHENGVKTFNFVSSWFVYGDTNLPMKEEDCCNPTGLYPITKRCAEQIVIDYCSRHNMNWRILRLGNVYGGPDKSIGSRNVLRYLIDSLREDKDVNIVAGLTRDYIHIYDACRAIDLVCSKGKVNEIYNVGSGSSIPVSEAVEICKKYLKSSSNCRTFQPTNAESRVKMALDCGKIFALGFHPLISLEEGLEDLCKSQKFCTPAHFLTVEKLKQQSNAWKAMVGFLRGLM
jgi:nucleoside-diphosphate-sugar epimerase